MFNSHKILFSCLVVFAAILACTMPSAQPPGNTSNTANTANTAASPDYVATITAQAALLQPPSANPLPVVENTATLVPPTQPVLTDTSTLTPTVTLTPSPAVPMVSVSADTNCRSGPGKVYDYIGALLMGQSAEVVGKNSGSNYWIIKTPGGSGTCWLWGQYATVIGNTANLPEYPVPPTPTPSLPASPTDFQVNISCTLTMNPVIQNKVHIQMSWTDTATNEEGYKVYRDGQLLATLGANTTSLTDDTTLPSLWLAGSPPPSLTYKVEAFNGAGKSGSKEKTVICP